MNPPHLTNLYSDSSGLLSCQPTYLALVHPLPYSAPLFSMLLIIFQILFNLPVLYAYWLYYAAHTE